MCGGGGGGGVYVCSSVFTRVRVCQCPRVCVTAERRQFKKQRENRKQTEKEK